MPGDPLVTVYLPTRNRSTLVAEAIDSVLNQTLTDFELIVVDDGSVDGTPELLRSKAVTDPRIRILRNEVSLGAPAARNAAIEIARGKFVIGLDDDDLMLARRLERLVAVWTGQHSLVCSAFWRQRGPSRRKLNGRSRIITLDDLLHRNLVGNQALMLTEQVRAVGGFDAGFVASQDYDLWVRMVERFGSALRIEACDHVVREAPEGSRISQSAAFNTGAVQFTDKYRSLMSASHLRSQRLLHKITAREHVGVMDFPRCFAWGSASLYFKYWAKCALAGP